MVASGKAGRKRVTFACEAAPGCEVFVAGTFNNWNPTSKPMKAAEGDAQYKAALVLPKGQHQYKFIVNGDWQLDGNNPQWAPNGLGSLNSVMHVG